MHLSHVSFSGDYTIENILEQLRRVRPPEVVSGQQRWVTLNVKSLFVKSPICIFQKLMCCSSHCRLVLCFSKLVFARRWHPPVIGSFLNPRRALVREAQHWQKSKTFCYASSKPTEKSVGLHCRYL